MNWRRILPISAAGALVLFACLVFAFPAPQSASRAELPHRIISGLTHSTPEAPASVAVASTTAATTTPPIPAVPKYSMGNYIEVVDSCGPGYGGGCVNARSKPTASSTSALQLRTGIVLPVAKQTITDANGRVWYKVAFTEWIRYPERLKSDLYIAADFVRPVTAQSGSLPAGAVATTTKRILVDRSDQKLYAYEGDELFMEESISTGLDLTPTPRGNFTVYRKVPSRYMQGPLPGISSQYYDLPGVPWNLYFTNEGGAIHGAYWHANFGQRWSHGCVNLPLDSAKKLYEWAPLGTKVTVRD